LLRARVRALVDREYGIVDASLLLLAAYLGSAMLGAVRQILLSARFGGGDELSAFLAAAKLPDTLFTLIAGGAITNAMVPVIIVARRKSESSAWRVVELTLTALLVTVAALTAMGIVFAPWLVRTLLAPGFDEPTAELTTRLTRLLLFQPLMLAAGSVAVAKLNSQARFFLPALAILIQNVSEIAGIGLSWIVPSIGIYGPALGVLGGVLLQALVLLPALRHDNHWPRLRWDPGDAQLRQVVRLLIPNSLLLASSYLGGVIELAFASLADEPNAIPALVNAWLLVGLPVRLIGTAAGQAAFPRLAAAGARGDWELFRTLIRRTAAIPALITALGIPFFLVFGQTVVDLLFVHGEYTSADGDLTYQLVRIFTLGLPFYAVTEVITRGMVSLRDTRTPLLTNVAQLVIRAGLMALFIDSVGLTIIPWSLALTAIAEALILGFLLWRRVERGVEQMQSAAVVANQFRDD
jgi:putative peptidoglycan lipid II flippase